MLESPRKRFQVYNMERTSASPCWAGELGGEIVYEEDGYCYSSDSRSGVLGSLTIAGMLARNTGQLIVVRDGWRNGQVVWSSDPAEGSGMPREDPTLPREETGPELEGESDEDPVSDLEETRGRPQAQPDAAAVRPRRAPDDALSREIRRLRRPMAAATEDARVAMRALIDAQLFAGLEAEPEYPQMVAELAWRIADAMQSERLKRARTC
jgi:hypothetical protein